MQQASERIDISKRFFAFRDTTRNEKESTRPAINLFRVYSLQR
jgi:hypothetical protein